MPARTLARLRERSAARSEASGYVRERPAASGSGEPAGFARFWAAYPEHPRRVGRRQALAVWLRDGLEANADAIVAHTERSAVSPTWTDSDRRWMPSPTRYLEEARFDAAAPPAPPAAKRGVSAHDLAVQRQGPLTLDRDLALGTLTRGEFEQLAKDTLAATPEIARAALASIEPRRNESLKWKMFELLQQRGAAATQTAEVA